MESGDMPMHSMGSGMDMGMAMDTGPAVFGFHLSAILMLASGIFYLVCAIFLWRTYRREKNELIGALFAFLAYQAVAMFFMGVQIQTMNMAYSYVATLAVFIGAAYMLKFPFSSFSQRIRRIVFILSLAVGLGLFIWFMQTPERQAGLMNFTLWYDIVVNGLVVGGFIMFFGIGAKESWLRIKAIGSGSGVVACCVVSNVAMLGGALVTGSVFQFAAPVIILASLAIAHKKQSVAVNA